MSTVKRNIEICPPVMEVSEETLVSVGHRCGYCNGRGWFWRDDGHKDSVKVPCPICNGHCEVDAVIEIRWQPSVHGRSQL